MSKNWLIDITSSIWGWMVIRTEVEAVNAVKRQVTKLRGTIDNDDVVTIIDLFQRVGDAGEKHPPVRRRLVGCGDRRVIFIFLKL